MQGCWLPCSGDAPSPHGCRGALSPPPHCGPRISSPLGLAAAVLGGEHVLGRGGFLPQPPGCHGYGMMGSTGERSDRGGFSPAARLPILPTPGWQDPLSIARDRVVPRHPRLPTTMSRIPKQPGAVLGGAAGRPPCRSPIRHPSHLSGQSKEKEKMKEGKEKDARYTNGHLFTTITVSGMTMCFACNKSITAKEALICPSE